MYGISPKLVKLSSDHIKKYLSQIFSSSFREGIVPDKLKSAVIYPIHKAETKMLFSNYRPISILPICSKIIEKLVHKRKTLFPDRYNILYKHRYSFQRGKPTDHAVHDLYTNLIKTVENRKVMFHFFRFCKGIWHDQSWHSRKIKILWHSWLTTKLV